MVIQLLLHDELDDRVGHFVPVGIVVAGIRRRDFEDIAVDGIMTFRSWREFEEVMRMSLNLRYTEHILEVHWEPTPGYNTPPVDF
jgi:hypothetical protein